MKVEVLNGLKLWWSEAQRQDPALAAGCYASGHQQMAREKTCPWWHYSVTYNLHYAAMYYPVLAAVH